MWSCSLSASRVVASTAARCTMLDANNCRAGVARAASGQHAVAVRASAGGASAKRGGRSPSAERHLRCRPQVPVVCWLQHSCTAGLRLPISQLTLKPLSPGERPTKRPFPSASGIHTVRNGQNPSSSQHSRAAALVLSRALGALHVPAHLASHLLVDSFLDHFGKCVAVVAAAIVTKFPCVLDAKPLRCLRGAQEDYV